MQQQVKLPLRNAFKVTMQGLRIRLGRSVVTLLGVASGIAFLMSMLTSLVIKDGVRAEETLRQDVSRMRNILTAEAGSPAGKIIGVLQAGPLSATEIRFLSRLVADRVAGFQWAAPGTATPPAGLPNLRLASPAEAGNGANLVLLLGDGDAAKIDWAAIFAGARQKVLGTTRAIDPASLPGLIVADLAAKLTPEDQAKLAAEARKSKYRTWWILVISLLVTIIGIANSMLMSVTERFREIGTMKCLGALSTFIRNIFLMESSLVGVTGSTMGALAGALFSWLIYSIIYGFVIISTSLNWLQLTLYFLGCVVTGTLLSVIAAYGPAKFASQMVPSTALRSNI